MIRVLHVAPKMDREGIQSFLMNVYRHIDRKKVQFDFLVHSKKEGAFDGEIASLGGKIYRLDKLSSFQFFTYKRDVSKILNSYPYKIVHSHINLLSYYPLKIAMQNGVPVRIAHSHSSSILDIGIKRWVKLYAKKRINAVATHQFACSKEAAIWQFGNKAYESGNVQVVPNGIDIEKFSFSVEARNKIRELYNIEKNSFVVGHVGAFRRVKNHSFVLKVFAQIKAIKQNTHLLLLGGGEMESEIKEEARALSIYDDVIFAKPDSNVEEYLSCMDAFIFPSIYEGLGIAVVEAQATGLPCFVSEGVSLETKLQENYFVLSLSTSPSEWAHFILDFFKNEKHITRKCSPLVFQYDINKVAQNLEEFYLHQASLHS